MGYVSKMRAYVKNKLKRFRRLDRQGGIEGLPMELMIIVVVATIGCGVVVGWMGNIEEPQTIGDIDSNFDQIVISQDTQSVTGLIVRVLDSDGDAIKGATVTLSGCGVTGTNKNTTPYGTTGNDGTCSFGTLKVTKLTNGVGYVTVSVSAEGYGEDSIKIPVVR